MKSVIAVLVMCLASASAYTQGVTWEWKAEPVSLIGIKFGVPLSESVSECPKTKKGYARVPAGGKMCWQFSGAGSYAVMNPPNIGMDIYGVKVETVEGAVESVLFNFKGGDVANMVKLLRAKYGPAQFTAYGSESEATSDIPGSMTWPGKYVKLTYAKEHAGKNGKDGEVHLYSKKYTKSKEFNAEKHKNQL